MISNIIPKASHIRINVNNKRHFNAQYFTFGYFERILQIIHGEMFIFIYVIASEALLVGYFTLSSYLIWMYFQLNKLTDRLWTEPMHRLDGILRSYRWKTRAFFFFSMHMHISAFYPCCPGYLTHIHLIASPAIHSHVVCDQQVGSQKNLESLWFCRS